MIVRKRKQLIQWDFLERGHAQDLQEIVERKLHGQILLDDRDERINRDGHPNLRPNRVLRRPVKRLDPKILFDPSGRTVPLASGACRAWRPLMREEESYLSGRSSADRCPDRRIAPDEAARDTRPWIWERSGRSFDQRLGPWFYRRVEMRVVAIEDSTWLG